MIFKKNITKNLKKLDKLYKASTSLSPEETIFYSKLAVLEYCGWIEYAFDNIARRSVKGKLKTQQFKTIFENRVIGNNHGFQYKENFRPMLVSTLGLIEAEKIESLLEKNGYLPILISELDNMKSYRNNAAHTCLEQNTTQQYPSPSVISQNFNNLYPIIKYIYSNVSRR